MNSFFNFLIILIPVALVVIWAIPYSAKRKHTVEIESLLKELNIPDKKGKNVIDHAKLRAISYITSHHLYQAIDKTTGVLGLVFSIGAIIISNFEKSNVKDPEYKIGLISLLAILFVVITLYVSPSKRIKQYKTAWLKSCDILQKYVDGRVQISDVNDAIIKIENDLGCDDE